MHFRLESWLFYLSQLRSQSLFYYGIEKLTTQYNEERYIANCDFEQFHFLIQQKLITGRKKLQGK